VSATNYTQQKSGVCRLTSGVCERSELYTAKIWRLASGVLHLASV